MDPYQRNWYWLWVGITAGFAMLPWVWWSLASSGRLMPPSGDALAIVFGFKPSPGLHGVADQIIFLYYAFNNPLHMLIFLFQLDWAIAICFGFIITSYLFTRKNVCKSKPVFDTFFIIGLVILAGLPILMEKARFLSLIVFVGFCVYFSFRLYQERGIFYQTLNRIAPLAWGLLLSTLYYGLVRRYFRGWNLIEGDILLSILLASVLSVIWTKKGGLVNSLLLIIWVMISNIYMAYPCIEKGPLPYQDKLVRAVRWVRTNTTPDTVIASVYGGILQWDGGRVLVDIAGNEDPNANSALKDKKLYEYLKTRNVKYVIDPDFCPFAYYKNYWGVDISQKLKEVYDTDLEGKDKYNFLEQENFREVIYELK